MVITVRACADRSWPSERTALPAVAGPPLPYEPPDDDDLLRESARLSGVKKLPTRRTFFGTFHEILAKLPQNRETPKHSEELRDDRVFEKPGTAPK